MTTEYHLYPLLSLSWIHKQGCRCYVRQIAKKGGSKRLDLFSCPKYNRRQNTRNWRRARVREGCGDVDGCRHLSGDCRPVWFLSTCIDVCHNIPTEVSQRGSSLEDVLRHVKGSLLGDALGEDGGLVDVKLQASIFLKDALLRQDLQRHAEFGLNVTIIRVRNRPSPWKLENTSPVVNSQIKYHLGVPL
eukprot:08409_1